MKMRLFGILPLCGLLGIGLAGVAVGNSAVGGDVPAMMVSPHVIVLAKVSTVTVHTNIPAADVALDTVRLNDVEPTDVGVDDCGDLVAKFAIADLALEPGEATLTLTGLYDGSDFAATEVVTVK